MKIEVIPWAWKTPRGKPVFNFRSEGRRFGKSDRCLIPADGFYEFTAPRDAKQRLKDKHLFTLRDQPWFWIAGIVKHGAFTMLTVEPGPDIAPYHDPPRSWCCRGRRASPGWTWPRRRGKS